MAPREFDRDGMGDEESVVRKAMPAARDSDDEGTSLLGAAAKESDIVLIPLKDTIESSHRNHSWRHQRHWPALAKREVIEQSRTFLPALQSMILSKIPWFITLRILGEMDARSKAAAASNGGAEGGGGSVELAAAALATTLCNVTGMSLCVGFSFALSTLAGQAKGEMLSRAPRARARQQAKQPPSSSVGYGSAIPTTESGDSSSDDSDNDGAEAESPVPNTPVVFLLRGLMIQLVLVVPVGMWWLSGIDSFLVRLGQTPELATHASTYLKILAPSLWIYSIQWTTTAWTQSIGMADVPATAALLGLLLHIPFNVLFCFVLGMGYLGCAYAAICFQAVQCGYIVSYLFLYPRGRQRVLESTGGASVGRKSLTLFRELRIAGGSLRGFCDYLGLALPGIVVISEWWASECAIFLSGRLGPDPETTLSAMTIYQSINSFCFMVPAGFAVAGTARVGNLLGAGDATGASVAGRVSVACCAVFSGFLGMLLYTMPHDFLPSLFVSEEESKDIVDQTAATIPFLAIYVFADGVQTGLNGIIKGCGRQRIVVPIVVVAYWVVGVPLAYYFGLYRNGGDDELCGTSMVLCGDVGLVAGMTMGTWCHMLLLAVVVVCTTDWKNEAYKALLRVTNQDDRDKRKRQKQRRGERERSSEIEETDCRHKLRATQSDGNLY
ncbi:unnamed protein product [Pseudo-nitzschia multistriata]|uniref:Multidrug and toxin extrusion protein n=1 Tax=Pseudo-nitzschia multistriata TaxID=183589 RepID=A0A448Z5M3_9STRA|nr:unnamed protein product [Pseudo-nitzschia multistriata]